MTGQSNIGAARPVVAASRHGELGVPHGPDRTLASGALA